VILAQALARMLVAQLYPAEYVRRRLNANWERVLLGHAGVETSLDSVRFKFLTSRHSLKDLLLKVAVTLADRPSAQPVGGPCDRHRHAALWAELFGVHLPFHEEERQAGTAWRYRMDDVDVLDPTGLYGPVYRTGATRGEIGASLSHAKVGTRPSAIPRTERHWLRFPYDSVHFSFGMLSVADAHPDLAAGARPRPAAGGAGGRRRRPPRLPRHDAALGARAALRRLGHAALRCGRRAWY
jgi:hypothetical protein